MIDIPKDMRVDPADYDDPNDYADAVVRHITRGRKTMNNSTITSIITGLLKALDAFLAVFKGSRKAPATTTTEQRMRMAKYIVDVEARRDASGNLAVYPLPAGDGGGAYEVAGINERYHPEMAATIASLIRAGNFTEAETQVQTYLVNYTDAVKDWSTVPAIEYFLRDCCFNRGPKGAARILQRALGLEDDGLVGKDTHALLKFEEQEPKKLLQALRKAREQYERDVAHRDESSKFWRGLVNRWNKVLGLSYSFLPSV